MEIQATYSYVENVIPPRCRKPRPQRFDDGVVTLNVLEVTRDQAPVAIICQERPAGDERPYQPIEYRWFGGRLWTDGPVVDCSRRNLSRYPVPTAKLDLVTESAMISDHSRGIYVSVREGREGVAAHLLEAAADWLIIDGTLYRTAGEPMYVCMTFGLGANHGGTSLCVDDFLNPNINVEAYFSLLEREQAEARIREIAAMRGDTVKVNTNTWFDFQILIPEAIQWRNPNLRKNAVASRRAA